MSKSVLLAIDGNSGGAHALQHILAFTDSASVRVVLAYVIEWSPYSFNTPEENAERHKRRESEISRAEVGVINPAQEHGVSEIVIGRRGQSGIKSLIFGSVAGSLIQTSPIPVVVVP